jgi:tripartite-type tricarboxylate transporter receptor subunit TctC
MVRHFVFFLFVLSSAVPAQDFPLRPLRVVVGFAPGAGTDAAARLVAEQLNKAWRQPAIVDNRAGAAGNIAAEIVAKALPDGYTLLVTSPGPIVTSPFLYAKLAYNPRIDLAPVVHVASSPNVIAVPSSAPASNVRELIAWGRAKPGHLNFASSGTGSTPHLSGELFKLAAQLNMVHIGYKSAAPAMVDLIAGRVDMMISSISGMLPNVRAHRLKAVAVTSLTRASLLPEVPTADESGVPGYESVTWWGVFTPAGVPRNLVAKVNQALVKSVGSAEMKEGFARQGAHTVGGSPAEFQAFIQKELARWSKVIKASGMSVE